MATFLFAWELGGDYGHLSRLLPVARELTRRRHTTVFAVRDLMGAETLLAPHQIQAFQAPLWLGAVTNLPDPISYAEMLMRFGFLNATALTGIARAWRNLVALLKPDVLVLDHAPTALLATRGLGLPRVNSGDGFCIPPAEVPMPPLRWWAEANQARLQDSEAHALASANQVLATLQAPLLDQLSELLGCDDSLFCTFSELDHYPKRSASPVYLGPIYSLGQGETMPWPDGNGPKVFAYLKAGYAGLETVLAALQASNARVLLHVPGASRKTLNQFASGRMVFSVAPLSMAHVAATCDLALCHGGAGTTAALLLAGKPLMLFPMQMEQTMTARRVLQLGAAVAVAPDTLAQLSRVLPAVLADTNLAQGAKRFAHAHRGYDQRITIAVAADRCEALANAQSR